MSRQKSVRGHVTAPYQPETPAKTTASLVATVARAFRAERATAADLDAACQEWLQLRGKTAAAAGGDADGVPDAAQLEVMERGMSLVGARMSIHSSCDDDEGAPEAVDTAPVATVYLAGPMRGFSEHNYPAFIAAAARLRVLGFAVINPVEVNAAHLTEGVRHPSEFYLTNDLLGMLGGTGESLCTGIALLPGWQLSIGARCEVAIAITLGYTFYDALTGEPMPRPAMVQIDRGYGDAPHAVSEPALGEELRALHDTGNARVGDRMAAYFRLNEDRADDATP